MSFQQELKKEGVGISIATGSLWPHRDERILIIEQKWMKTSGVEWVEVLHWAVLGFLFGAENPTCRALEVAGNLSSLCYV